MNNCVFSPSFFSCPEPNLEPESACKWMERKRINLWSGTAFAGDFCCAPGPPKSALFPTPGPELSELHSQLCSFTAEFLHSQISKLWLIWETANWHLQLPYVWTQTLISFGQVLNCHKVKNIHVGPVVCCMRWKPDVYFSSIQNPNENVAFT